MFIILWNIYHETFYLNSSVTLTYLEPYYIFRIWYILKNKQIQNGIYKVERFIKNPM